MKQREVSFRGMWNCQLVALVAILMAGCCGVKGGGALWMRPTKATASVVQYRSRMLPRDLSSKDYRAIENIIGRIRELGDPVIVEEVFVSWPYAPVSALFRTQQYDIYVVRDRNGKWMLSTVKDAPVP